MHVLLNPALHQNEHITLCLQDQKRSATPLQIMQTNTQKQILVFLAEQRKSLLKQHFL